MTKLREAFEKEMTRQGRDTRKDPNGQYSDYASAVMWSWAQWGAKQVSP